MDELVSPEVRGVPHKVKQAAWDKLASVSRVDQTRIQERNIFYVVNGRAFSRDEDEMDEEDKEMMEAEPWRGKPFFLIGIYRSSIDLEEIENHEEDFSLILAKDGKNYKVFDRGVRLESGGTPMTQGEITRYLERLIESTDPYDDVDNQRKSAAVEGVRADIRNKLQ